MRLTHFIKLDQDERDSLQASICPAAELVGDASIRISQDVPGGAPSIVWLTIAEHDAIADLVWSHRPDSSVQDFPIVDDVCGATLAEDPENPCVLMPDHLPVYGGAWTHIDRQGRKFNDTPSAHG